MSSSNRIVLILLPLAALVVAFWLLVLGPKREQASQLEDEAAGLQSQVNQQVQAAVAAEAARRDFPEAYRRLVVLGKATPSDDDTASLLVQLDRIAADTDVEFLALKTGESGESAAPAPSTGAPATPAGTAESSEQRVENAEGAPPAPPPAAATEASAASLPIGASVGPAGLPVMKYNLEFEGDFFRLADFLDGVDDLVDSRSDGGVGVRGRLLTIDNFKLKPVGDPGPNPVLTASFEVTTYLTPADQGATGGADPAGPAPVTETQPVAADPAAPSSEIASTTVP